MKKIIKFIFSKKYLYHLIAILLVWILIVVFMQFYLKSHTNFGQKIEVPKLYKIHADDLAELMNAKNLKYEIVDSVYVDDWPKGTVCWQYPRPTDSTGEYVKNGRVIQVSIVPLKPKMILIPSVLDESKRMGESKLESLGLRTKISYKPSNVGPGYIMEQLVNGKKIKPNQKIKKGGVIELVVAKGNGGAVVTLPNLVGLTISQARSRLLNLSLTLHVESSSVDVENAIISNQSPIGGEGASVASGTIITVWTDK